MYRRREGSKGHLIYIRTTVFIFLHITENVNIRQQTVKAGATPRIKISGPPYTERHSFYIEHAAWQRCTGKGTFAS
jgi:hypothetical protein